MQRTCLLAKTNVKLQNPGLVAFYNVRPRNGMGLFLQPLLNE